MSIWLKFGRVNIRARSIDQFAPVMHYRILTFALVILFAGCEMTTEPSMENTLDSREVTPSVEEPSSVPENLQAQRSEELFSTNNPSEFRKTLAQVRAATAKYQRLEVAIADGYAAPDPDECVSSPDGAMGVHYINFGLVGDGQYEPTRPEVLVYEPQENGRRRLVAVEWVVFQDNMDDPDTPPEFFGHTFDGPSTHGLPPHFELHAWLWRHNPNGTFAMWNPNVTCP